jgi:hypothetical protein
MIGKVWVLVLGALLWLPLARVTAAELAALQQSIAAKQAEVEAVRTDLAEAEQRLAGLEAEQQALVGATDDLAARRSKALATLKAQFERVVADPEQSLEAQLREYREAAAAQERHAAALRTGSEAIATAQARLSRLRAATSAGEADLAKLSAGLDRARAQRLLREINVVGEQRLTNAISCSLDETIAGCIERGEQTARRVARDRFAAQLLDRVTEAETVAKHQVTAGVEPQVVEATITDSGFRGQGEYFVTLTANLRTEATLADACRLLGLTEAQCRGELSAAAAPASAEPASALAPAATPPLPAPEVAEPVPAPIPAPIPSEETPEAPVDATAETAAGAEAEAERYRLTIRSNVYYDEVYIDGVPYGSTKLDVMLPPGEYDVEVRKPGHEAYRERISLNGSRTLRAQLAELAEP